MTIFLFSDQSIFFNNERLVRFRIGEVGRGVLYLVVSALRKQAA